MSEKLTRLERGGAPGDLRHSFAVIGPKGAVEFWFHTDDMECSGFEKHSRTGAGHWDSDTTPSHPSCGLLDGQPCWHDGTSLWASEYWVPGYEAAGEDWVWNRLERAYAEQFHEGIE